MPDRSGYSLIFIMGIPVKITQRRYVETHRTMHIIAQSKQSRAIEVCNS